MSTVCAGTRRKKYEFVACITWPWKVQSPEDQATTEPIASGGTLRPVSSRSSRAAASFKASPALIPPPGTIQQLSPGRSGPNQQWNSSTRSALSTTKIRALFRSTFDADTTVSLGHYPSGSATGPCCNRMSLLAIPLQPLRPRDERDAGLDTHKINS